MSNSVDIWIKNAELYRNRKYKKKSSIICNVKVNNEFLFVRRLFLDGINSRKNFTALRKYHSFKSSLSKHVKSLNDNINNEFAIGIDFNKFLKYHGEFLMDIYYDCINQTLSRRLKLLIFTMAAVDLFYKWRKKRNDSIRNGDSYDNRRKSPYKVGMLYYDNIVLDEAKYCRRSSKDVTVTALEDELDINVKFY